MESFAQSSSEQSPPVQSVRDKILRFLRLLGAAAHKAASPAGEKPVMVNDDEPSSHNRLGCLG